MLLGSIFIIVAGLVAIKFQFIGLIIPISIAHFLFVSGVDQVSFSINQYWQNQFKAPQPHVNSFGLEKITNPGETLTIVGVQ